MTDPQQFSDQLSQAVEADLRQLVEQLEPAALQEMVAHHFGWLDGKGSGKGIRPLMCLLACAATGGEWKQALPAATSIELIHNFSLIHDDIQDQSALRRHRPTVWKLWGPAQAINTGDALFALARLSSHRLLERGVASQQVLQVQHLIDQACLELTKGQHLDLAFDVEAPQQIERYLQMIEAKTSSLLAASCAAGATVSGAGPARVAALREFGLRLGLAFQIMDDVLGTWGAVDATGKSVDDDLSSRKPTYPALYGLQNSAEFTSLWVKPGSQLIAMIDALDAVGARQAAQSAAAHHTDIALAQLAESRPELPAGEALRGLADRLLERHT